jgi:GNAT superfamily N-acetyltransferase
MTNNNTHQPIVEIVPLASDDCEQFVLDNQEAFYYGAREEFGRRDDHLGEDGQIISRVAILESIAEGDAYRIVSDGWVSGGLVVRVEGERGDLELLFVSPRAHSRGIGQAAWRAVEQRYPSVRVWGPVTPYFERRNIHFYVNKLGFHIVEYFNSRHPDPNEPDACGDDDGGMFRFEKELWR